MATKKQYKSMRGKIVDMDLLRKRNELTPAVGNARVNARGDELGPGGKIIRKREDIVADHYGSKTVRQSSGRNKSQPSSTSKTEAPAVQEKIEITEELTADEKELLEELKAEDEWIEDEDGNFVKKGEK